LGHGVHIYVLKLCRVYLRAREIIDIVIDDCVLIVRRKHSDVIVCPQCYSLFVWLTKSD